MVQGYFMLYESMLDTVIYARDKWLINPQNGEDMMMMMIVVVM